MRATAAEYARDYTLLDGGTFALPLPNRHMPDVNFQYFGDATREKNADLEAVVDGVRFARSINLCLSVTGLTKGERILDAACEPEDDMRAYVRHQARGHRASGTNIKGADDDKVAVLDSRFRVRHTTGLRVVDAPVFPKIAGYFIVSAVYMISEKAADILLEDAAAVRMSQEQERSRTSALAPVGR